jgi:hypothetical protein
MLLLNIILRLKFLRLIIFIIGINGITKKSCRIKCFIFIIYCNLSIIHGLLNIFYIILFWVKGLIEFIWRIFKLVYRINWFLKRMFFNSQIGIWLFIIVKLLFNIYFFKILTIIFIDMLRDIRHFCKETYFIVFFLNWWHWRYIELI